MHEGVVKITQESQLGASKRSSNGLLSKLLQPFAAPKNLTRSATRTAHSSHDVAARAVVAERQAVKASAGPSGALSGHSNNASEFAVMDLGFPRDLEGHYLIWREIGRGGNGVVKMVTDKKTGQQYACKCLRKELPSTATEQKKRTHVESIMREINVLRQLKGSLNVVELRDVFEDDDNIYIVMEHLQGGELWHRIGDRHYSERTVASFMRAVFRTLAQCHSHHILHRDIKPGNFMLLNSDDRSPLKAIDFGLAVPYEPDALPRSDLGLEGTPWYMAPEVLSSQVTPAADIWAAGVMAFQLLTGRFPFDDRRNPGNPSISAIFKSVLTEKLDFSQPYWDGISQEAKQLVAACLDKDPAKRPTAKQMLAHPWLQGTSAERSTGKPIASQVVQRIQRYAQSSVFKRSVLQGMAHELLSSSSSMPENLRQVACPLDNSQGRSGSRPVLAAPCNSPLNAILAMLIDGKEQATFEEVSEALTKMGFKLDKRELNRLLEQVDISNRGVLRRSAVAASQVDWAWLQRNQVELWVEIARKAFTELDHDQDGVLRTPEILECLKTKLPEAELRQALTQAMAEAGEPVDAEGIDFQGFLKMLHIASLDSLDQYDDRLSLTSPASLDARLLAASLVMSPSQTSLARSDSIASEMDTASEAGYGMPLDMSMHSVASPHGSVHGSMHGNGSVRRALRPRVAASSTVPGSPQLPLPMLQQARARRASQDEGSGSGRGRMLSPTKAPAKAFNFDVGPVGPPPKPSPPQHAPVFNFDVGPVARPAAPLQPQTSFRFDVGPGSWQAPQKPAAAASPFNFDIGGVDKSEVYETGNFIHTKPAFNFDVGPVGQLPPPPPLAKTSFRFDVGPGSLDTTDEQDARPEQDSEYGQQQQPPQGGAGMVSQLSSNIVTLDPRKAERVRGGCHFDRRMHGGNLYRIMHANGAGLPTVAE